MIERRSLAATGLRITIPFNSWSEPIAGMFRERLAPGALNRTLESDAEVLGFWNHNADMPLGRRSAGTLELSADDLRLTAEIRGDRSSWHADARAAVEAGNVRGSSFGFIVESDQWERGAGIWRRTVLDAQLVEVSPTATPAYPQSTATV